MSAHSPLGPSAADRWIQCPGSVAATADLPDVTSQYAAEGTFAHDISELIRKGEKKKDIIGFTNTIDGFEFTCDQIMYDYVMEFVDYVHQHEFETELIEAKVTYDAWVDGGFGTLDSGLLADGTIVITDLKYGKGVQVFAENNFQLMCYALGVFQEHGHLYEMTDFKLVIHQPRLNHVDEWAISVEDLLEWAESVLEPAADLTAQADAPFKAGSWCKFCKLRGTCRTRAEAMQGELLDEISEVRNSAEMTNDEMGMAMSVVPLMVSWCADVAQTVEKMVVAGQKIKGADGENWKMVAGRRPARAWRDNDAAEKAMRAHKLKVGDIFTHKLKSPAQLEKLPTIGKGHVILKKHTKPPGKGKPTLVPGSDPREAYVEADVDELKDVE